MRKIILLLSLLLPTFIANANFMVYPISKDIKEGGSELIRVYSKSKDIQYIKIYTKKVMNPGTKKEYEIDTPNWEGGVVTTPSKLILPAGSSKSVRLTQLKAPDAEEVYRVYFESVKPEKPETTSGGKSLKTDLSVNIIYAALVRVQPRDSKSNASISLSTENNLLINNTGNIKIGIKDVFFCKTSAINDDCIKKTYNKNVYPGASFDTEVSQDEFLFVFIDTNNDGANKKQGERIQINVP